MWHMLLDKNLNGHSPRLYLLYYKGNFFSGTKNCEVRTLAHGKVLQLYIENAQ